MQRFWLLGIFTLLTFQSAFSSDYPLYIRFIPYNPPNLHLTNTRATNAYYIPGVTPGTTYNFIMD